MSKCFRILLAELYVILTGFGFIILLRYWGLTISHALTIELLVGWTVVCFSSAYFLTGIFLAFFPVRKPMKAEEDQLTSLFREVLQQARVDKTVHLLIEEEMGCNAFAIGHRTIAVSRGMLGTLEPEELKGVLAHELGHLESGDCVVGAAYTLAGLLPLFVTDVLKRAKRILLRALHSSIVILGIFFWFLIPIIIAILCYCFFSRHVLLPVAASAIFVWLCRTIRKLFNFLWRTITRYREYEQDAYASGLGFGPGLRQALLKATVNQPQSVRLYDIVTRGGHPMIYNRIRRLEKLEGLR